MREKVNRNSRTSDVDALTLLIIAAYVSSGLSEDERLTAIIEILKELSAKFNLAINHIKTESKLKDKNEERNVALRGFFRLVSAHNLSTDETIKTASDKVLQVFNHYGLDIAKKSYGEHTSLTNSLITDLSTEEMLAYIAVLPGVGNVFTDLQNKEAAFEASNLAFEQSKAEEGQTNNATIIKPQVINAIDNFLVNYLYILTEMGGDAYVDFSEVVNQLIIDNNVKVKKRVNGNDEDTEDSNSKEELDTTEA